MPKLLIIFLAIITILLTSCSSLPFAPTTPTLTPLPPMATLTPTIVHTPTATPLPATPSSPQGLQYNPQQNLLLGENDFPLYHLGENAWLP
ncbi:MAG: hypothetical protein J7L73_08905, partial [Anaerolineales bacterium]|nr:hypothetical protein [Anaerolineales bacterium]